MRRLEAIAERILEPRQCRPVAIDIHQPALLQHIAAQIVDAVDMVGMRMRVERRVEPRDAGHQHLLAKIRTGVDDDARRRAVRPDALGQRGAARAPVLRVGRIAIAPVAGDARRAGR